MDDLGSVGLVPNNYCELIDDISSIHSRNASIVEESINSFIEAFPSDADNNFYSNDLPICGPNQTPVTPVMTISDIKPVIIEETHDSIAAININSDNESISNNLNANSVDNSLNE